MGEGYVNLGNVIPSSINFNSITTNNGTYHLDASEFLLPSSSTTVVNWANGSAQATTASANTTFVFNNGVAGGAYLLRVVQDTTGGRTYTWPASVKWATSANPIASSASHIDIMSFYCDGSNFYGSYSLNY